jgi:transposase
VSIRAGDQAALLREVARAKQRAGVPPDAAVVSCYEIGRDGFWVHRWLTRQGITNHVVDAASIEVPRRRRPVKTDRLDAEKLVLMLVRYCRGDHRTWRVVRVPTEQEEDARQRLRVLRALRADATRLTNRIKGVLATQGCPARIGPAFDRVVDQLRRWDGQPLPAGVRERVLTEWQQLQQVRAQWTQLERATAHEMQTAPTPAAQQERHLRQLKAIGVHGATIYVRELFAWRRIRNRRELTALAGLAPTPRQSGARAVEWGISKAGNRYVRAVAVQLAWGWLRYQPHSTLTAWYHARFGGGGPRLRRLGIVALARKLLIALWRYLETGVVPEGARLRPTVA